MFNVKGYHSNCSVIEAIKYCEKKLNKKIKINYVNKARKGDHIWYISNLSKLENLSNFKYKYNIVKY